MELNESILMTVRKALGLNEDDTSFDTDLKMFINIQIGKLNQNGVGNQIIVTDGETWADLRNAEQVVGNESFLMVPGYITMGVKLLFDPPPPSSADYYVKSLDELLWRLKVFYEESGDNVNG